MEYDLKSQRIWAVVVVLVVAIVFGTIGYYRLEDSRFDNTCIHSGKSIQWTRDANQTSSYKECK